MPAHRDPYQAHRKSGRLAGAGLTVLLHAGVVAALLSFQPVRTALTEAVPIMVRLVTPPAPAVERPAEPPKPLPVKQRVKRVEPRPEPPPVFAASSEAPPPPSAPAPPPIAPPAPAPVIAAPAPPAVPAPAPVIPPSFNAAYLDNPPPAYPSAARRMGQQGKVVLRVRVNAMGNPDKVELRASSGFARLDEAALDAVRRWRFVPARLGDKPVASWVLVPILFTLEG